MKNIKTYIDEQSVNESFLGIAAGVVAGLIGFKVVKAILGGLAKAGIQKALDNKLEKDAESLEKEWIPELESMLKSHPKSYDWIKEYWQKEDVKGTLTRVSGTLGSVTFVDDVLSKDEWSDEDAKKFKELWDKAFKANKAINDKLANDLLNTLK